MPFGMFRVMSYVAVDMSYLNCAFECHARRECETFKGVDVTHQSGLVSKPPNSQSECTVTPSNILVTTLEIELCSLWHSCGIDEIRTIDWNSKNSENYQFHCIILVYIHISA